MNPTPPVDTRNLEEKQSPSRSILDWVPRHPILTVVLLLLGIVVIEFLSLPSTVTIEELKSANPPTTALMEKRQREREQEGKPSRRSQRWVPLSKISPDLMHAVIVAEDGTFYEHGGFDWYEVQESLEKDWNEGRVARGGSTITQQLAKNLFLSTSKDPIRKLKEAYITMQMERILSKDRILELYLNLIEWGDGLYGAEAAAQEYFGKSAAELTREEAARIAAVIPNPRRHKPNNDSRYVNYRLQIILAMMEARGW